MQKRQKRPFHFFFEAFSIYFANKMAKQAGFIFITGCIGNICFYRLYNEYYARMKSSLSEERVKRDIAFRNTMQYAEWMAAASKIGSEMYRSFPKERKCRKIYQQLTGKALKMLRDGWRAEDISKALKEFDGFQF